MNNNQLWKNIEVPVAAEAKANHVYIAKLMNVEFFKQDEKPMYKFFYEAVNSNGEILSVNRNIREDNFRSWLSTHTGYDKKARQPLQKIADEYQLILVDEYNTHSFVKFVRRIENLVIHDA